MDVFQCPVCELRFRNAPEMDAHIRSDHPRFFEEWDTVDDFRIAEAHRRRHEHVKRYRPEEDA